MALLPLIAAFALGNATKKSKKPVSKYTKANGTKVKAYTRKARQDRFGRTLE